MENTTFNKLENCCGYRALKSNTRKSNWGKLIRTSWSLEHTVGDSRVDGVGEVAHVGGYTWFTCRTVYTPWQNACNVHYAQWGTGHGTAAVSMTGVLICRVHAQHRWVHRLEITERIVTRGEIYDPHRSVQQYVGLDVSCANMNITSRILQRCLFHSSLPG